MPLRKFPEKDIRLRCGHLISPAAEEARALNHPYIGVEHLFIALTRSEQTAVSRLLRRAGLTPRVVRTEIRREVGTGDGQQGDVLPLTPRAEMVLSIATFSADHDQKDDVADDHLLLAMLQEGDSVPIRKLAELGFDVDYWLNVLLHEIYQHNLMPDGATSLFDALNELDDSDEEIDEPAPRKPAPGERIPTPLLDKYGRDLNVQAAEGKIGAVIARESELRTLARTLARSKKNNPLLLGDAGVGKTAVVEGLAYAIQDGSAPKALAGKRIIQIEIGTLVAGTSLRGQFEERLIGIVEEARKSKSVILFIDEIHTIVGAGDTIDSSLDAANILKPALARGEIVCIGATTHEEYRRAIAADPALDRRFRPIDIDEPSQEDALAILGGQRLRLETHHAVTIRPEALETAVRLAVRYLPDRRLPDKAIDLLDEACARVVVRSGVADEDDDAPKEVRVENVTEVLSEWTGIPLTQLTTDERRRLSEAEAVLRQRVIGQDDAVEAVGSAIRTARAGLGDPNRPIGVFLFLGPSGVGKTELARALADFLFGSDEAMLRLDMSEFHDSHTVARLIGAPPGYKDAERGGQLTDGLRRRPYSVVLLDEVEKAAPEVFDLFLQVFDDGRLSDARGGHVDARNAVFIMTSNIGTEEGGKQIGFMAKDREPDYSAYLNRFFRPEFLNRLDEVVVFRSLTTEAMAAILDLQLAGLRERLEAQHLQLSLTEAARALILQRGYDPVNGARPLKRAVERLITRPLGARIVEDAFQLDDVVLADVDPESPDRLAFAAAPPVDEDTTPPDAPAESTAQTSA